MAWNLRLVDRAEQRERGEQPQIGDCWFARYYIDDPDHRAYWDKIKSPEYVRDWEGKRAPLMICLPCGVHWCPDQLSSDDKQGWTVTGEAPHLTIRASISYVGYYHGWVTDGILSDDIEGRHYDSDGNLIKR